MRIERAQDRQRGPHATAQFRQPMAIHIADDFTDRRSMGSDQDSVERAGLFQGGKHPREQIVVRYPR